MNIEYNTNEFGYICVRHGLQDNEEAIQTINKLHDLYTSNPKYLGLKQLRKETIDFAIEQFQSFGSFYNYLVTTLETVKLTPNARRFLLDTYQFINTGKRTMDILGYEYLLVDDLKYNRERSLPLTNEEKIIFKEKGYASGTEDIFRWLSLDNGFQDMIWSLRILFGSPALTGRE